MTSNVISLLDAPGGLQMQRTYMRRIGRVKGGGAVDETIFSSVVIRASKRVDL